MRDDNRPVRFLGALAAIIGIFSALLGLVVLIGWYTHNATLIQLNPTFVPMQYNTALGFFLTGMAICLVHFQKARSFALLGGLYSTLAGFLTLAEYIFGLDLGIDQLFMKHYITTQSPDPGRMAPNTALCFVLMGIAILLVCRQKFKGRALVLSIIGSAITALGAVALFGYIADIPAAYSWGYFTRMALHTTIAWMLLGIGVAAIAWREELEEGQELPRWLPIPVGAAVFIAVILLGQALVTGHYITGTQAERDALYLAIAIFGLLTAVSFSAVVYMAEKSMSRAKELEISSNELKREVEERKRAENKLEEFTKDLENRVEKRTKDLTRSQEATLNILEDLTEAKTKLEKEALKLEEAMRIKSDFTSTVSHELRTPLAAIKEGIAIVSDGTAGGLNEEQKNFLNIAKRNVDRLVRLIDDILTFQKMESKKIAIDMQENDINDAINEAGHTMAPLAEEKGIELILELGKGLPRISFNKDKIAQVLANLLNNAIKFTEKGSVRITTSRGENFIKVAIEDTGPGIKKENIERLFKRFEQLESGIDRKIGGTGLGLAICKEIIALHNSKIWAESEFGKGSTFCFILPIAERRV